MTNSLNRLRRDELTDYLEDRAGTVAAVAFHHITTRVFEGVARLAWQLHVLEYENHQVLRRELDDAPDDTPDDVCTAVAHKILDNAEEAEEIRQAISELSTAPEMDDPRTPEDVALKAEIYKRCTAYLISKGIEPPCH